MENVTRTIYSSYIQAHQFLGLTLELPPNSTLNQRLNILPDAVVPEGVWPWARYFCIGLGGHAQTAGADGIGLTREVQHKATDAAQYKPLPFVLRAVNDDLTPLERTKYALRRLETHNSVNYVAYYLRRIDMDGVVVEMQIRTQNEDGSETITTFVPTTDDLVPTPPDLDNLGVNPLEGKHAVVTARLPITMNADEMKELMDAAKIIYGDERYAIISELALCTGADQVIQLSDSSNFREAIGVQIATHTNTMHIAKFTQEGIDSYIDVGANEPLFKISPVV